jgi:hypothetical protein
MQHTGEAMSDLEDELETIIDRSTLSQTVEALGNVCTIRAERADNTSTARHWNAAAVKLERLATAIERLGI